MTIKQQSETSHVSRVKVTGMKFSKGSLDNGTAYDSTKVFVEIRLDESKGNARGRATTEYYLGKSDEYQKYAHLPMPFIADCEMEDVISGKNRTTQILQMIPVEVVKTAAQAAPAATPNRAAA